MPKQRRAVLRINRGLVHCIATCSVCTWSSEDYLRARKAARDHVRSTGHRVAVDEGIVYEVIPG